MRRPEKRSYRRQTLSLLCACMLFALGLGPSARSYAEEPAKPVFKEIWAYLMQGEEKELTGAEPVTDIGFFGTDLNKDGRITEKIARPEIVLKNGVKPHVHLVINELSNPSLMHFSLDPHYGVRPLLIGDMCRVAEGFDGLQIDFESVSADDAVYFYDFLAELRRQLPSGKTLSVAVPARTETIRDAYDYPRIASIADRIIIMAYDEHWSSSAPGPVASLPWCAKVVEYAKSAVGTDRIVMGLPLYGRAWQDKRLARALRFKNVQDIIAEKNSTSSYASELGAYFEYSENVVVKVFYDDERSIMEKLQLYRAKSIDAVSFWRIGLGPPGLWSAIDSAASRSVAAAEASPSPALPE